MNSIQVYSKFADLPAQTERFLDKSSKGNVFFSLPWYQNFVENILAKNEQFRAYACSSGVANAETSALLLMRSAARGPFAARKLEPMANYYASLFGPSLPSSDVELSIACKGLAEAITNDKPKWDQVNISPMAQDDPGFEAMNDALLAAGFRTQSYFCFGNWYLKTQGKGFDEYFEGLPSQLKNTVNRKRKQLEAAKRGKFDIVTGGSELDAAIAAYEKIYNASWKIPEPYPNFVRGLIKTCANQGWLRMGVAYIDGEPAAAQIWIVYQGIASIYKLAYDERFSKTSVGSILTTNLMRYAMDVDHVREVDYLTGDDSYKRDWMSDRRERWGIMAYNLRTPLGLALAGTNALRGFAKRLVKFKNRVVETGS